MQTRFTILLFSLFIIGCQNTNRNDGTQIVVFDLKELPRVTSLKLSDLGFRDIEYIPLETNVNSQIPRKINLQLWDKILVGKDHFIIKQSNTVLKFRNDGSFISKIGIAGRGPEEFQTCHDVEVDDNGQIFIVDGWKKKFFIYSEMGDFIKTVNFPLERGVAYVYIDGKFLCYNQNNLGNVENSYNLVDTNGEILRKFPNRYPFIMNKDAYGYVYENIFYRFNNRIFKKEVYSDTVFSYENMIFKPHMVIEVGDKLITTQARSEFDGLYLAKNYIIPRNLFEFGDYLYYEFTYSFDFSKTEVYSFIGSKQTDFKALIDPEKGLTNDLDGGPNVLPLTIKDDNTIIGWIEAIELKNHIASETFKKAVPKYPEKKKEIEEFANSLKETDNPVLIMVSFKDNR
jgi:hypothetical protein